MQSLARVSAAALGLAAVLSLPLLAQDKPRYAGPTEKGFLLPNGWTITPAGEQVPLNDLVLNILPLADGKHALVTSDGFNEHELSLVDLASKTVVSKAPVRQSWFGLAHDPATGTVWWAGAGSHGIHTFKLADRTLTQTSASDRVSEAELLARREEMRKRREAEKKAEADAAKTADPKAAVAKKAEGRRNDGPKSFQAGLAFDPKKNTLYSLDIDAGTLTARDAAGKEADRVVEVGGKPYGVVLDKLGSRLYISDWAGRQVVVVDVADFRVVAKIAVGEHPNQIIAHPKDGRVFVACASSNSVSVIDTTTGRVVETISTALFPLAPEGSTPDALAVSPDGETLYVANADNNCVAVVDIAKPARSGVKGFIPTGWYPTALAVTPDGKHLLVGVGKGNQTKANPPSEEYRKKVDEILKREKIELPADMLKELRKFPYIGTTLSGALSIVAVPDDKALASHTEQVYKNCPYSDKLLSEAPTTEKTIIPTKVGQGSPIEHVIYVIKENRTYDQVFGDMPRGNGDPTLTMFGEKITPNHHKLADEFVLLDNLYCNGQVSRDGHPWSTMAYNTDYVARDWILTYSRREGVDDDDEGHLSNAPSGFIWDAAARAGKTYRNYGEAGRRVSEPDGSFRMEGSVPSLVGHMAPKFGITDKPGRMRDTDKLEQFLEEFRHFEKTGNLPNLITMSLGEDHTSGTTPGAFTPEACVASNDLALGRLVEAVSKSKFWPKTAIFVIEDDAQNGPDHVDAHRTVGLVISPYTKRHALDSTQYQTVSMIRTIELLLGLQPLSQYDAAANPMFASFTDKADLTPYDHVPAKIDLNAVNLATAYGADRSAKMDFTEYDRIDDFELNEILWHAVKGKDAPMPPAVRRAIAHRIIKK
ncbi:MAG: alkaline phosphatase family protein [Isosphaeraceae bacterium]|nr:alkaline phosphatase family protein [Isosphaeraceae bacterium]